MRRSWQLLAAALALVLAGAGAAGAAVTAGNGRAITAAQMLPAGDGPAGFWWGSDSWPIPVTGSAPYSMPRLGGAYGGYIGMTGNWAYWLGCGGQEHFLAYSAANAAQARTNFTRYHRGVGYGAYWFMGGPGVDPHYNGTTAEASAWGARQAARALKDIAGGGGINLPVVWMDVELPGITPAPDNGWNSVYTSPCSGVKKQSYIPVAVDRAEFNGFANYVTSHSPYKVGVYSSPGVWTSIFGTGTAASIPDTYEWTYQPETSSLSNAPYGWCLKSGGCAAFFGGQTSSSPYALMWQWSGGGGVRNGVGDFDQIHTSTAPASHEIRGYAGKCADDTGDSSAPGTRVQIWSCLNDASQQWSFSGGELKHGSMCMNDSGWGGSGSHVILWTCNGAANELWSHNSHGEYVLKAGGGRLCLDDPAYATRNGTQLIVYTCHNSANQHWSLP